MTTLMAIGGAVDFEEPIIFEEFVQRAGEEEAQIVILPQASSCVETGSEYRQIFKKLGVKKSISLEFRDRSQADKKNHLEALRRATGVCIGGGTKFEEELMIAYRRGAVVAGTSAGAATQSKIMIAYGRGGATPRERIAQFSFGLGFTDKILFDQHFGQRDRLGRLIYAICTHPGTIGVGVDENTAAILQDDRYVTVCGKNAITILDGKNMNATNVAEMTNSRPVAVSGLTVHVLTEGCSFDLQSRKAMIPNVVAE